MTGGGRPRRRRRIPAAAVVAAAVLAMACASCGSGGGEAGADAAAGEVAGAGNAVGGPGVDYGGLASYDCEKLGALLDEVAGSGDRDSIPHDEGWTAGTSYRGGCAFEGDGEVSIEIHLADPDQHSIVWLLAPDLAAERAEQEVDVGDEAYLESTDDGLDLLARKGLVEVSLRHPAFGGTSLDAAEMTSLAAAILEPWPSGPGADETSGDPAPPDVPLPPGVTGDDLEYFDAQEFARTMEELDADGEGQDFDPEVIASFFTADFSASPAEVTTYCEDLRAAGLDEDLAESLATVTDTTESEPSEESPCALTEGEMVVSVAAATDGYSVTVSSWDEIVRILLLCEESPERCEED